MNASSRNLLVQLLGLALVATFATGCGALRKNLAKNMGVEVKTVRVKTGDLGGDYKKLEGSELDFLSPAKSSRKARKGKKRPKDTSVKITYKKFGVKSVDDFNATANQLYAQYVFADKMLDKTHADLKKYLKVDATKISSKEISRALNKGDKEQLATVRKFKENKKGLELAVKGLAGIIDQSAKMKDAGSGLVSKTPGEMAKDPARALYADEAVKELYRSIKLVGKVASSGPDLIKKLARYSDLFGAVF